MEGKTFPVVGGWGGGERERIKFLKIKMEDKAFQSLGERGKRERKVGGTSSGRALCRHEGRGKFSSQSSRVGWQGFAGGGGLATRICSVLGARLGVGTGCCRGWEGFLARGGVPSAGGVSRWMMLQAIGEVPLPARRHSRWQWGYQSHGEGERKMNCWVRRESANLFDSPVGPPIQMFQFWFDCFLV